MIKILFTLILLVSAFFTFGQDTPKAAVRKLGPNPFYMIDSIIVTRDDLGNYKSDSIAVVDIYYDSTAVNLFGKNAKDGAFIAETRSFAHKKFITFFRKESQVFDSLYNAIGTDNNFVYIVNDKIRKGNFEGSLSSLSKETFNGIKIISKEELLSKFSIKDKDFGILINSSRPKDLAEKKF